MVSISEHQAHPIWSNRSELVERLKVKVEECELCGSQDRIEVHHIKKLTTLKRKSSTKLNWQKRMMARNRKSLIVCQKCHNDIHHGKYDGKKLSA